MTTSGPYDATGTSSATRPVTGTSTPTRPVTGTDSPTRSVDTAPLGLSHTGMTSAVMPEKPSHPSRPPN